MGWVGYRMFCGKHAVAATAVALAVCCGACSGRPQQGALVPVAETATEGTSLVPVLIATTRQRAAGDPGDMFGSTPADQLSYASVTVSIPPDDARKVGAIQWPTALPGDPRRDFVTVAADYLDKKSFAAALSAEARKTGRSKVLVFIHGFNNRFDEALYRFAQIVHDSKAPGIPVLFSWPSRGEVSLRAYQDDFESTEKSRDAAIQFLGAIAAKPNVKEVNVLCHSMGCLLTTQALWSMAGHTGRIGDKIKNVLLVAPDVPAETFRTQVTRLSAPKPRFAVFLSQDDGALKLSQSIWGGVPRLGGINPDEEPYRGDFQHAGVEVFDLTALQGAPHGRAFEDVTSVMDMVEARIAGGQQMTEDRAALADTGRQ
jgi:esterase/lipase superfamily enzyme